jgi:chromosome partitioning protein
MYEGGAMARVLAVGNQKGGSGKTTTIMNLAGGLTRAGYKTLVVDADEQSSAMTWSLAQGQGTLPFDVSLARQFGGRPAALLDDWHDIVLVDCPSGVVTGKDDAAGFARKVIMAADGVLVPLQPSTLDFSAARTFVRFLVAARSKQTRVGVILNCLQRTNLSREARGVAEDLFASVPNAVVLKSTIGRRAPITEVSGSGKTIFDYAPNSTAALEYRELTKEIIQWLVSEHPLPLTISATSTSTSIPANHDENP